MNDIFIRACFGKDVEYIPVWFMRQVGRYLPEYKKLRQKYSLFELIKNPELSASLASYAVKFLNVDAAILFSDITIPLMSIGIEIEMIENFGPKIKDRKEALEKIKNINSFNAKDHMPFLFEGIQKLKNYLNDQIPIIGFSAAPFTLISYLFEDGLSRDLTKTKIFMLNNNDEWKIIMKKITYIIKRFLQEQINHGVNAIQLFDSWVGALSREDYVNYVKDYTKEIFESLPNNIPKIHFSLNSNHLIQDFAELNFDVLSIDWRIGIFEAYIKANHRKSIQGNMDPVFAVVGGEIMENKLQKILNESEQIRGYIFNLGHGVLKETPVDNLIRIVNIVHNKRQKK